ncbi:hypothetical protein PVAP13_7NG030600 [Panicum virgatum]|uniref:Uncharacterized protein n=1 Tax=Panicum virgatum TaxID=38727 RepID=A0A8T0PYF4_PANVG|nr:hypothetical protein PVAP13_7NG030600 [Panicum virgatum]
MCWGATLPKLLPSSSIVTQVQSQERDALRDPKAAPGNRRASLRSPTVFGGRRLRRRPSEDGAAKTPSPGLRAAWKPGRPRKTKTKTKALRRRSCQDPFARTPRRVEARPPPEDEDGAEDEGPPKTEPSRPLRPDSAPRASRQPTCAGRQPMCASRQPTWARLFLWPVGLV